MLGTMGTTTKPSLDSKKVVKREKSPTLGGDVVKEEYVWKIVIEQVEVCPSSPAALLQIPGVLESSLATGPMRTSLRLELTLPMEILSSVGKGVATQEAFAAKGSLTLSSSFVTIDDH